jgi:hypothetical protein
VAEQTVSEIVAGADRCREAGDGGDAFRGRSDY